ncbi:MAG: hypothetical protein ACI4IF_01805 [Acutalibacteraceae bacterium]
MKTKSNTVSYIFKFLTSVLLTSAAYISVNYYIEFVELTAGSYNIAMLFNRPLRDFLIILLLLIAGILAFLTFTVKSSKSKENKVIYPYYLTGMGALWIVLPFLSVYTVSRFTGTLIYQTVSSIAIIANVVFMMISVCCGLIASVDIISSLFSAAERDKAAGSAAVILSGIPTGCGLSALMIMALNSVIGLSGIFTVFGVLAVAVGVLDAIILKSK